MSRLDVHEANRLGELLDEVAALLGSASEARWIVSRALSVENADEDPAATLSRFDVPVSEQVASAVAGMVGRRRRGEPLQYVLGTWDFRTLDVEVDPRVLIPRPETEQVAGYALEELNRGEKRSGVREGADAWDGCHQPDAAELPGESGLVEDSDVLAVDLGTGSGVIALSLAAECRMPSASKIAIWATDSSSEALAVLGENLRRLARRDPHAASRVRVAKGTWFDALPPELAGHLDLVVSNPPYVSRENWSHLDPEVRLYEPRAALVAGDTGLECLKVIVRGAARWLKPGGSLVLELSPEQSGQVAQEASLAGFDHVEIRPDLAGRDRALVARLPEEDNRPGLLSG
jgi:release factor glutamine methyltransferase